MKLSLVAAAAILAVGLKASAADMTTIDSAAPQGKDSDRELGYHKQKVSVRKSECVLG